MCVEASPLREGVTALFCTGVEWKVCFFSFPSPRMEKRLGRKTLAGAGGPGEDAGALHHSNIFGVEIKGRILGMLRA